MGMHCEVTQWLGIKQNSWKAGTLGREEMIVFSCQLLRRFLAMRRAKHQCIIYLKLPQNWNWCP